MTGEWEDMETVQGSNALLSEGHPQACELQDHGKMFHCGDTE